MELFVGREYAFCHYPGHPQEGEIYKVRLTAVDGDWIEAKPLNPEHIRELAVERTWRWSGPRATLPSGRVRAKKASLLCFYEDLPELVQKINRDLNAEKERLDRLVDANPRTGRGNKGYRKYSYLPDWGDKTKENRTVLNRKLRHNEKITLSELAKKTHSW